MLPQRRAGARVRAAWLGERRGAPGAGGAITRPGAPRASGARSGAGGELLTQPLRRLRDAVADVDLRLPAEQALGLAHVRPAALHVDGERRQVGELERLRVAAADLPDDPRDLRDRQLLRGGDVEVLVQAGARGHRADDAVGDVVDMGQRARLLTGAEDLERVLAREALAYEVGDGVRDARLVVGHLARPVGVERAADRERQPVLVMGRAAPDLAGELREAVRRLRHRDLPDVLLGRRKLRRALEHHRRGDVDEARHAVVERGLDDRVIQRAVDGRQRVRQAMEVRDPADDRGEVDDVGAARRRLAGLAEVAQVAGVDLAALAHPLWRGALVGHPDLVVGVAQQTPNDRGADRAGAAGDEHAAHAGVTVYPSAVGAGRFARS